MDAQPKVKKRSGFQQFFLRGLAILLPTVLTIWIVVAVYGFVDQNIAGPINAGVRSVMISYTEFPAIDQTDVSDFEKGMTNEQRAAWRAAGSKPDWLRREARRQALETWWGRITIGNWQVMNLIGLLVAAILIYSVGRILGSFIGRRIYVRIEGFLQRLPVFKHVYPHVKQVTDFLVGSEGKEKLRFSKVVAVEYPRKGMWSVGLVTGDTMRTIQERAGRPCVTIFVPSSPTPFTGYVITVPIEDMIELPVPIDQALKFTVSGGVIVPPTEVIEVGGGEGTDGSPRALPQEAGDAGG
ncbi:MAG: DUF502 domain-containing protein [Planctomycetes bacterium]|nr:DUF502 domain-containing protein [Planctomycetota bacterium]